MLFSYHFDADKKHLLNCKFNVLQFTEKEAGKIEIIFSAEIAEVRDGKNVRREVVTSTFTFPPNASGVALHDINFTRVRHAEQKKWIFTVENNRDTSQKATVGLITATLNKNPMGLDIVNTLTGFEAELKGNNLSILEQDYVPEKLKQTLVNVRFEVAGYPEKFSSVIADYDSTYQNYKLGDLIQDFTEPVPAFAEFKINIDIAPYEIPTTTGLTVFDLMVPNLGRFTLLKNGIEFLMNGGTTADIERSFFTVTIRPEDFWNNSMTNNAKLEISGDGNGQLTYKYGSRTITTSYDPSLSFDTMAFKGALMVEADSIPEADYDLHRAKSRVDNISVIYTK